MPYPSLAALALVLAVSAPPVVTGQSDNDGWRTIEFETTEVTTADVALSPDGQWLIFTLLGHLFRLSVEGGDAEQLTFGPYYDTDLAISPDGNRVAFVSDRDGSEGNVFVLELATGAITQVTHEFSTGRPNWAPDGTAIVYLSFVRAARNSPQPWKIGPKLVPTPPALVRRVASSGGDPETLSPEPRLFRSVFYLPDGRLAWTVIERENGSTSVRWDFSPDAITRIEVLGLEGTVSTLRTLAGYADPVSASPIGDGLYSRRSPRVWASPWQPYREDLLFIPLPEGLERRIVQLSRHRGWTPWFSVAADNSSIYLVEAGRLWKVAVASGVSERIAFSARVRLEIYDPGPVAKPTLTAAGSPVPPRSVLYPVLSPDGRILVFGAAGYLWEQPLDGGPARRLFEGDGFEEWPAFSPDGTQLAYTHSEDGIQEVRVFDFVTGQIRSLGSALGNWPPSWSRDGKRLVFGDTEDGTDRVVALNLSNDTKKGLIAFDTFRSPRPHLSGDGQALYYSDTRNLSSSVTGLGGLYRLPLNEQAQPQAVTELEDHLIDGLVSPDGKWLAFRRNMEIWMAPMSTEPVREQHVRRLSLGGGNTFSFAPDGSAIIYSAGNRVWRQALAGGGPEEIPIRLELSPITAPPLLVRRARVLDFDTGGFRAEASILIQQGRIRWIGDELGQQLPHDVVILDAGGRFVIPGLFDMHVHGGRFFGAEEERLALGITSVRGVGGALAWENAATDRGEASADPVPRYFYSGETIRQFGQVPGWLGIHSEEEARTYVRRWKERGAHHIKVYNTTSWPLMRAVAQEARRLGLPVVGHGTNVQEITKSGPAGCTSLEHAMGPSRAYDDVLQMLAAAGTRWDPTLGISATQTGKWDEQLAGVRAAYQRGVKMLAGTDARPAALHLELGSFVEAALSPLDVLRIATQGAAAAVGAEEDLGTLEVGKLADIVLLDANPLEDIKNTQTIWRVIKGGFVFDPEELRPSSN